MNIDKIAGSMLRKEILDAVTKMQQKPDLSFVYAEVRSSSPHDISINVGQDFPHLTYDHVHLSNLQDRKVKFSGMVTASGDGGAARFSFKGLFDQASKVFSDLTSFYRGGTIA